MMDEHAQNLLLDLMGWLPHEDLRPLIKRTIEMTGQTLVENLPTDPNLARGKLIDVVENYLDPIT